MSNPSIQQFAAPAEELIQALQFSAAPRTKRTTSDKVKVQRFQRAYTALIRAVPADLREHVQRWMIEGLENVSPNEMAVESVPSKAAGARVSTRDFMAGLERQETLQRAWEIDEGMLISSADMAERLPMTKQGLSHALKAKRIFTLLDHNGKHVYPAFFADRSLDRKQLEQISKALGDLPGAAKWDFFMSPRVSLDKRTPLQALAKGRFGAVMTAAGTFADE